MESTRLSSWLTLAANVGVILGILLLVVEIRQNTAASKAQTAQAIIDSSRDFLVEIAMDEEFAALRETGHSNIEDLSEIDAVRFSAYSRGNWLYFQNVWVQWTLGVVDDRIWSTMRKIICDLQSDIGNAEEWKKHRPVMDNGFVEIVESCLEAE